MTQALSWILKQLARLTIWRFRPGVIAVTGSVGKTSAKIAIKTVIAADRSVRWARGNMNNEIGLPLAILGDWNEEELKLVSREVPAGTRMFKKLIFWINVLAVSLWTIIFGRKSDYPEIVVLEYGADRPGDMKELIAIARPNVSVITAIGDVPAHIEFYPGPEEVAREKGRLIECLPSAGFAILNCDDPRVLSLKDRTRANIMTYGFSDTAHVRISGFEHRSDAGEPIGVSFKLEYGGSFVPVRIDGVFGKAHAYAAAAGACVGLIFAMNLIKISEALASYKPAHGRGEIVKGIHGSFVIDDTYNASVLSMLSGLHTLSDLPGARKVAILGDMLEIGEYSEDAHIVVGKAAAKVADVLVAVGARAKFIAEAARAAGVPKRNIHIFATTDDAKMPVPDLIKQGDLILVKGSRAMRLDEIVDLVADVPPPTV